MRKERARGNGGTLPTSARESSLLHRGTLVGQWGSRETQPTSSIPNKIARVRFRSKSGGAASCFLSAGLGTTRLSSSIIAVMPPLLASSIREEYSVHMLAIRPLWESPGHVAGGEEEIKGEGLAY